MGKEMNPHTPYGVGFFINLYINQMMVIKTFSWSWGPMYVQSHYTRIEFLRDP